MKKHSSDLYPIGFRKPRKSGKNNTPLKIIGIALLMVLLAWWYWYKFIFHN